jgi:alkylation response protein AidB-like acyl-CoA dehydrogenase
MEFADTAQQARLREELRDWLAEHLVGDFARHRGVGGPTDDSHWELRLAWERELAAGGWLGITWPPEYGGRGGTLDEELVFLEEHFQARAPYWVGVHGRDLFGPTLLHAGTPEQCAHFLPRIMACDDMWGQGFSEPEAGSDLGGVRTRARLDRDAHEWVIDGQKIWMTFGSRADWLYVLCRTDPDAPKHRGLSLILVPAHQPGVDVRPIRNLAGGEEFAEVFFTGARTAADLVVGPVDGGWGVVMGTVGTERGTTVLPYQAAFEQQLHELLTRARVMGRTQDRVVRDRLVQAWIGLQLNRVNNARMLTRLLHTGELGPEASLSKLFWSQWHRELGSLMMDVVGAEATVVGDGYSLDPFQTVFLNSRAETIYGGANEIQRNIVAERVLGLPREPRA